ncbi:hypothetical protein D3OALGB2SA_2568 [Olavius algarvensis associated proteobacterium Delta 3]|nr:hypothetical protein D3OALGB2SA_2568 [Olavius algarvensis associated proteobacterium Delta 3]
MTKIDRIVYLHEHHFSERYFQCFGFPELIENGFHLEIWNFMPFLANEEFLEDKPPDTFVWENHVYFNTSRHAVDAILRLPNDTVVLSGVHYTPRTLPIYRALSRTGVTCFSLLAMALPLGTMPPRKSDRKQLSFGALMDRLFYSVPYSFFGVKPVNVILGMGEKYFRHGYPCSGKSEVLWVHSFDYDEYLRERIKPDKIDSGTCVFLDEYVPLHPDNTAANLSRVPMQRYYDQMRSFFDHIENKLAVNVVIAAHPRSHYEDLPGLFGKRPVIRGKTAELVKNSGFVILHQSMSMNFAVLFEKPMIFVVTDDYLQHLAEDPHPQWLAGYFGKKLHNLDTETAIDLDEESYIDRETYRSYRNDYIKKEGSPEKTFSQIVTDRIRAMNRPVDDTERG